MPEIEHLAARSGERIRLANEGGITLTNQGPGTLYYGGVNVSSFENEGSLSAGSSLYFANGTNITSASKSRVRARHHDPGTISFADEGVLVPARPTVNFTGNGVSVSDNTNLDRTDIDISGTATPGGWYDVTDYGAVGDWNNSTQTGTDNTAAIQAAIDDAKATSNMGAVIYFPPGMYKITDTLDCNDSESLQLMGAGGRKQWNTSPAIIHTADTSDPIITFHRATAFGMKYLRVEYWGFSYTGHMVQGGWGSGSGDAQQFEFYGCAFRGRGQSLGGIDAASCIDLTRSIIGTIEKCHFGRADTGITHSSSYMVGVSIRDCTFNAIHTAPIHTFGGAEAITMESNVFEPRTDGSAGCWKHEDGLVWGGNFNYNWAGDVSLGGGAYVEILNSGSWGAGTMIGNRFAHNGSRVARIEDTSDADGVMIGWNRCDNGELDFDTGAAALGIDVIGNSLMAAPINGTRVFANFTGADGFHNGAQVNATTPAFGVGLLSTNDPQFPLDVGTVSGGSASVRLLGSGPDIYFGGTEGAADPPAGITWTATKGVQLTSGVDAVGTNLVALTLQKSASTPTGIDETVEAALYAEDDATDGKVRVKVRDEVQQPGFLGRYRRGTTTWNPGSVADGAMVSTTVTVTGAAVGDCVMVGFPLLEAGVAIAAGAVISAQVTATNTVRVVFFNKTGGNVDLDSGTLIAHVWSH